MKKKLMFSLLVMSVNSAFARGNFYCKDYFTLKNVETEKEQSTYPKYCDEVLK